MLSNQQNRLNTNQARVVVTVKPGNSTSNTSGITRYIAESKRDQAKEELREGEARPLFSDQLDNLDYHQANDIIGQSFGDKAQADQFIHLVISLEPNQFEALGDNLQKRKDAVKEIVREAVEVIHEELGTKDLDWFAAIHLNTDYPHAHVVIGRDVIDAQTGEPKHIDHLPRTLLPHRESGTLKAGLIADAATMHLNVL